MLIMYIQLKNFIQRAKFDPEIDDNYFARSQENIGNYSDDIIKLNTAKYIVVFYGAGIALSLAILIMVLIISLNTNRWDKKPKNLSELNYANMYSQAKIFGVAITTFLINLYIFSLDCLALHASITNESDIKEPPVLKSLPKLAFYLDIIAIIIWLAFCTVGLCSQFGLCFKDRLYTFLAISTLGPSLSLLIHLPYILIAYLNDASYASSIFIYYTIIIFIMFGALDLSYGTCMGALKFREDHPLQGRDEDQDRLLPQGERRTNGCNPYPMFICGKTGIIITFIIAIPVFTILILGLMVMITAALVVIPISKSLSDAPNRLFGFYQIVIVLVGAYFAYRKLFSKKPSLESVVEETEENIFDDNGPSWGGLSNDEKLKDFYSHIMKIAGKIDPSDNNIKKRERQPTQQELLQQLGQQLGQQHQESTATTTGSTATTSQ